MHKRRTTNDIKTCVLRAWDVNKPVVACPAMNTSMWHHPLTEKHLQVLENLLNYRIIQPISKKLACGDTGKTCVGMFRLFDVECSTT